MSSSVSPEQCHREMRRAFLSAGQPSQTNRVIEIFSDDTVDVSELFSRPRLVPRCPFFNLVGGQSFDLKDDEDIDLGTVNGRASIWHHIALCQPKVMVLSPPCTLYSQLMHMWVRKRIGEERYLQRRVQADRLLEFACQVGMHQLRTGGYFIFEHPDGASSWNEGPLVELSRQNGVITSRFDECRFGLVCPGTGQPIRKRTRLLHNLPPLDEIFGNAFCTCEVPHRRIEGSEAGIGLSAYCETYPDRMVEGMLQGIRAEVSVEMVD